MYLYANAVHQLETGCFAGQSVKSLIFDSAGAVLPADRLRPGIVELLRVRRDANATGADRTAADEMIHEGWTDIVERLPDVTASETRYVD